jgi:ATP-dependent DNA helicase RecG
VKRRGIAWRSTNFSSSNADRAPQKKRIRKRSTAFLLPASANKCELLVEQLPFELTAGQNGAARNPRRHEERQPIEPAAARRCWLRKTVVAMIAILIAVENDYQAVLMAPTEISPNSTI